MICPSCKSEYRVGFTRCNDCDVDLVDRLPAQGLRETDTTTDDLVIVFASVNWNEAAQVKSLLEGSGVEVTAIDENMPRMDSPASMIIGGVKIAVPRHQEQLARDVLAEFRGGAGQDPGYGRHSMFASETEELDGGVITASEPVNEEFRCVHCHTLLEPESTVCSKCGDSPF